MSAPQTPGETRLIGRSRTYTAEDLPARLRRWHAPRVNRWERLCVTRGVLVIETLQATGALARELAAGGTCWFVPGERWRVAGMPAGAGFEIEVHADSRGQAKAPQPLRSELLEQAPRAPVANVTELNAAIGRLQAGERCIIDSTFAPTALVPDEIATASSPLFWHPLTASEQAFTVLAARGERAFDLAEYLARDHAVIEAALGLALTGHTEGHIWLRATLGRHLHIEEELLFPAWLQAGGKQAHVDGLLHEHRYLRQHLADFDDADHRRKFLRLLDAHDEKEEQVIYPDLLARVGPDSDRLLQSAMMAWPTLGHQAARPS